MTRLGDALIRAYTRRDPAAASVTSAEACTPAPLASADAATCDTVRIDVEPLSVISSAQLAGSSSSTSWNWPPITESVLSVAGTGFQRLAERLRRGSLERGICSVAFSGTGRDVGRTTVILSLARVLREHFPRESLLLIDADFARPGLTLQTGLAPVRGVWEMLQSDLPVQSALHLGPGPAGTGRLALLPLAGPVTAPELETIGPDGLLPLLTELREQFPLILIDAGVWNPLKPPLWKCAGLDGLIHVQRHDAPSPGVLHFERALCREMGLEFQGVVETFAPAHPVAAADPQPQHHHLGMAARIAANTARLR